MGSFLANSSERAGSVTIRSMSSDDSETRRLRLVVRRHGLPEVRVVFNVSLETNPTVAGFLEQVNDVIPLESDGNWGLEDYVVELRDSHNTAYECLHFQPVSNVLKADEEVLCVFSTSWLYTCTCGWIMLILVLQHPSTVHRRPQEACSERAASDIYRRQAAGRRHCLGPTPSQGPTGPANNRDSAAEAQEDCIRPRR